VPFDEQALPGSAYGICTPSAEFYSRNLATEVIKGSVQKAKNGGTPGRVPVGYLNIRRIENGREARTVEIDPERGPLMAWAFEAYATGEWTIRRLLARADGARADDGTWSAWRQTARQRQMRRHLPLLHLHWPAAEARRLQTAGAPHREGRGSRQRALRSGAARSSSGC
jgi:hypothetical protein